MRRRDERNSGGHARVKEESRRKRGEMTTIFGDEVESGKLAVWGHRDMMSVIKMKMIDVNEWKLVAKNNQNNA